MLDQVLLNHTPLHEVISFEPTFTLRSFPPNKDRNTWYCYHKKKNHCSHIYLSLNIKSRPYLAYCANFLSELMSGTRSLIAWAMMSRSLGSRWSPSMGSLAYSFRFFTVTGITSMPISLSQLSNSDASDIRPFLLVWILPI